MFETCNQLTIATAEIILEPPALPMTNLMSPFISVIMEGVIVDMGILPGAMSFAVDCSMVYVLAEPGYLSHILGSFTVEIANR